MPNSHTTYFMWAAKCGFLNPAIKWIIYYLFIKKLVIYLLMIYLFIYELFIYLFIYLLLIATPSALFPTTLASMFNPLGG